MASETPLLDKAQFLYEIGIEKEGVENFTSVEPITDEKEIQQIKKEVVELKKLWDSYTKTYRDFLREFNAEKNPKVFEEMFSSELQKFIKTFFVLKFQIEAKLHELKYKKRVVLDIE